MISGAPQMADFPVDPHEHLDPGASAGSNVNDDATLEQQVLDLPQRWWKPNIHRHREPDDLGSTVEITGGILLAPGEVLETRKRHELDTFHREPAGSTPARQRRSSPAGSECCMVAWQSRVVKRTQQVAKRRYCHEILIVDAFIFNTVGAAPEAPSRARREGSTGVAGSAQSHGMARPGTCYVWMAGARDASDLVPTMQFESSASRYMPPFGAEQ